MSAGVRRALREPLVHFALLGAALFWLYGRGEVEAVERERVVVTEGDLLHLATTFARTWNRPPTKEELRGLVDDHVRTEVLAREAEVLGLDRSDTVIRRRLRQKMEFVAEDLAATEEPTEEELAAYLREHPEPFLRDTLTSFRHVYVSPEGRERPEDEARELLARLRAAGSEVDTSTLGDRLLLPSAFEEEPERSVASWFGSDFAAALAEQPVGTWSGPVRSGYGLHLVLVTGREGGYLPALDEVRDEVRRELLSVRRERARDELLREVLEQYEVVVHWPDPDGATSEGP